MQNCCSGLLNPTRWRVLQLFVCSEKSRQKRRSTLVRPVIEWGKGESEWPPPGQRIRVYWWLPLTAPPAPIHVLRHQVLSRQVVYMLKSVGITATCVFFRYFRRYRPPTYRNISNAAKWCKSRCGLYLRINNLFQIDNIRVSILYKVFLESTPLAS